MSYSIIFQTKVIKLSDGRLLHLNLSGCNNDNCGRKPFDWNGKIYTKDEFVEKANSFKEGSRPMKESLGFDLKIRSRYCTYYDYGDHLLRMMKRAVTLEELRHSGKSVFFDRVDGAEVKEDGKWVFMPTKEFCEYYYKMAYSDGITYRHRYTPLESEEDIIHAFDNGDPVRIYISK